MGKDEGIFRGDDANLDENLIGDEVEAKLIGEDIDVNLTGDEKRYGEEDGKSVWDRVWD